MTLLATILIFGVLIFIHEFGHFIVAKRVGISVEEFSLGMGPKVLGKKVGETLYSLRAFPVGGFVRMAGMEPGEEAPEGRGFNEKPVLERMSVIFAGPFMNFLLAIVLFVIVYMILGVAVPTNENVVGQTIPGRAAEQAGLKSGDRIIAVNGQQVENWNELTDIIHGKAGQRITLTVVRDGKKLFFEITPEYDPERKVGLIGIYPTTELKRFGVLQSVWLGLKQSYEITKGIIGGFAQVITGQEQAQVAGPIGIYSIIGQAVQFGLTSVFNFAGILSLHLGLINLFPIPALDGSRLVFLAFEGLRGKPVDPNKENLIHFIGFALLMLLMVVITYNDLVKLFG
ncbi:MAG: RIP metalloprotease RseP [Thermoanaerobacteraceae bacterium]|nr:RIP metalloprotease RseP [Thermoanaerobacteraceae bacterium]